MEVWLESGDAIYTFRTDWFSCCLPKRTSCLLDRGDENDFDCVGVYGPSEGDSACDSVSGLCPGLFSVFLSDLEAGFAREIARLTEVKI